MAPKPGDGTWMFPKGSVLTIVARSDIPMEIPVNANANRVWGCRLYVILPLLLLPLHYNHDAKLDRDYANIAEIMTISN